MKNKKGSAWGEAVSAVRKRLGLKQDALATETGLSVRTIRNAEAARCLSRDTNRLVVEALNREIRRRDADRQGDPEGPLQELEEDLYWRLWAPEVHVESFVATLNVVSQRFDPPLSEDDVRCRYAATARSLASEVTSLVTTWVPGEVERERAENRLADNNRSYSLGALRFERPQATTEERVNRVELTFEPTDYHTFMAGNLALDRPLLQRPDGTRESLRSALGLHFDYFDWLDISDLPVHTRFGTVTAVETADEKLVIAIRSRVVGIRNAAAGLDSSAPASLSCAEGMVRPTDVRADGIPSPFRTVARGLKKELGLVDGTHYFPQQIALLALGFDKERAQPLGVFTVRLPEIDFKELEEIRATALDALENKALVPVDITLNGLTDLLLERVDYKRRTVRLFSNHHRYGVWVYACFKFEVERVRRALSRAIG